MNIILLVLAFIFLIIIFFQFRNNLPRILSFLHPGDRHLYFEDNPQPPIEDIRREMIRPVIEKLEAVGFSQLGIMVDKPPLWAKGSREIALASPTRQVFASIGFRGLKPSYFFYTPFTGGQMIITAHNSFRDLNKDDFITTIVPSGEVAEMLETHKNQVEKFVSRGFTPYYDYSRDSVIQATNLYYNSPYPRRQLRIAGTINLLFMLICILIFVFLLTGVVGQAR
jgi:hypothetical protein